MKLRLVDNNYKNVYLIHLYFKTINIALVKYKKFGVHKLIHKQGIQQTFVLRIKYLLISIMITCYPDHHLLYMIAFFFVDTKAYI